MHIGIADYGLTVWDGGCWDLESRLRMLKGIGYTGIERLTAVSEADAIHKAMLFRKLGMDFTTCRGPDVESGIHWTAALGKSYVWVQVLSHEFDTFCRQANVQAKMAAQYGVRVGIHNHLNSPIETQEQLELFLERCPDCGLIFDSGHLSGAGGDCLDIIRKYHQRLLMVHVKDYVVPVPSGTPDVPAKSGRFCELGAGNSGLDNKAVLKELVKLGYDGWICVEHDCHLREPEIDLKVSREFIRNAIG